MKENLFNCNAIVVPINTGSTINMLDINVYKEEDFHTY